MAALAGGILFLLLYGPSTLDVTYDSWIFNGYLDVDILQHYAGWAAFRAGEWAFPLTFTGLLSWPLGGAASLADCIPLFALPAKLLDSLGLLPATFQYFGWFVLFCMVLSGWAGAKLLGLFITSPSCRVLGSLFFAASPILLERAYQHTALTAHWLVILALYFYFRARRQGFEKPVWAFVPLSAAAAATHVYFVPMVLALCLATAVDGLMARRGWRQLLPVVAATGAALLVAFLLGFFSSSEYVPGGFGNFGINLNTFWNPVSLNWGQWDPHYPNLIWSRFLRELPVVGDSLTSFSYLGLGVLLGLLVFALLALAWLALQFVRTGHVHAVSGGEGENNTPGEEALVYIPSAFESGGPKVEAKRLWRRALHAAASHAGLLFSCLCLTVFAVSNVVTANSRTLFTVPLPDFVIRLCDIFRTSGRMIWPVYYLLVLFATAGCCRLWLSLLARLQKRQTAPRQKGTALAKVLPALFLCLLLAVQVVDLSPALQQKHDYFAGRIVPASYADPENWDKIAQGGRVLYLLEPTEDRINAMRAALAGMPSNYYLLARGDPAALARHMEETRKSLLAGSIPFENAAFFTKDDAFAQELAAAHGDLFEIFPCAGYTVFLPVG